MAVAQPGTITTIAGTGAAGFSGDGGLATVAKLNTANEVDVDGAGNLYICDQLNRRIRKVDTGGIITTVAGIGTAGSSGDGGPATAAKLNTPGDGIVDGSGNLYIADFNNHRIRKINTSGIITPVVGVGAPSFSGEGGQATAAALNNPVGVALDGSDNLHIADTDNNRIRKVLHSSPQNIAWTNWTSASAGNPGSALGSLGAISISYTGEIHFAQTTGGTNY